jgi:NitT/TauT family transport system substrate-binding protein
MNGRFLPAVAAIALIAAAFPQAVGAETLKIASPIRGSWEGAIPELGKQAGIFQRHGLDLDILYTQGAGETLQVVVSVRSMSA